TFGYTAASKRPLPAVRRDRHSFRSGVASLVFVRSLLLVAAASIAVGCAVQPEAPVDTVGPDEYYRRGRSALEAANYIVAIDIFRALQASYPFSNVTRQAQLDLIYAYYRSGDSEEAIAAAAASERGHPTHPRVAYSLYMRGPIYLADDANVLQRPSKVALTQRPP